MPLYTHRIQARELDVTRSLDLSPGFIVEFMINNQSLHLYADWRGKDSPRKT